MMLTALIPAPYRILALILLALALVGFGWVKGAQHGEARLDAFKAANDKAVQAQFTKAAQTSANLASDALVLEQVKNEQVNAIRGRLDVALGILRERPERGPDVPGAAATCRGASGAELSRPDSEFLEREAARADELRAALGQCQAAYGQARAAVMR